MAKVFLIKQIRSTAQCEPSQKDTLRALGLKKMGHTIVKKDFRVIRGMLNVVQHLIEVKHMDANEVMVAPKKTNRVGYILG